MCSKHVEVTISRFEKHDTTTIIMVMFCWRYLLFGGWMQRYGAKKARTFFLECAYILVVIINANAVRTHHVSRLYVSCQHNTYNDAGLFICFR